MFQEEFVSVSPLNNINEIYHWQNKPFIEVLPYRQENKTTTTRPITNKIRKNKRKRTTFTTDQIKVLEKTFASSKYLNGDRRRDLAKVLGLAEKCLKVWFQNKRMKEKRETSESSDSLSEQYNDSMSPESQVESPDLNKQSAFVNYNTGNINYSYIPQNNQDGYEQNSVNQSKLELNQPNFNNPSFVQTSFYDNYGYPTQYYPYLKTDYNYNKEPNNGYYEYCPPQTWSSDGFDLSYLQI